MPQYGSRHGPIDPAELPDMLRDLDKRLRDMEKTVPNLIQRIETNTEIMHELKDIVVKGNSEAMEFMWSVIGHEQNMDVIKQQLKTDVQKTELEMKKRQLEQEAEFRKQKEAWERKQTAEKEKWLRDQKTENRAIMRSFITKFVLIAGPVLTALAAGMVKMIDRFGW